MAETGKYEKFRELLTRGIGTRTKKEFADATGITRETISRLINKEEIPQPSKDTLARIARNITNCTLNDLFEACGYPRVSLEENVEEMEDNLLQGIEYHLHETWTSVEEFAGVVDFFWIHDGKVSLFSKENEVDDKDNPADYYRDIGLLWKYEGYKCEFDVRLFYVKNKKNHVVFTGFKTLEENKTTDWKESNNRYIEKERQVMHTFVAIPSKARNDDAEERLFAAIFGEGGDTFVKETITGNGFHYSLKTAEDLIVFKNFVCRHAGTYCTSKKENDIFQLVLNYDGSLEELKDMLLDREQTVATIIAVIMARETGLKFEDYDENDGDGYIVMYECETWLQLNEASMETLYSISQYAKELNVPEFGACYWEARQPKNGKVYKTADYYLMMSDKK